MARPPDTFGSRPLERLRRRHVALMLVALPMLALASMLVIWPHRTPGSLELVVFVISYAIANLGIGVGYHRYFTHKSFKTHPWLARVLAIMGATAGQGPVIYWTALHRMHHAESEREGDPHSPHFARPGPLAGFWHAHVAWMFRHPIPNPNRWTPELLRDGGLMRINRSYLVWFVAGLFAPGVVVGLLTGSAWGFASGVLWGGLIRTIVLQHVIWSINSVCHLWGSRPYDTKDRSANNFWLALPSFGESWHNNHHAFPSAAVHGMDRGQIDISGATIRLLAVCRLAWDVRTPGAALHRD